MTLWRLAIVSRGSRHTVVLLSSRMPMVSTSASSAPLKHHPVDGVLPSQLSSGLAPVTRYSLPLMPWPVFPLYYPLPHLALNRARRTNMFLSSVIPKSSAKPGVTSLVCSATTHLTYVRFQCSPFAHPYSTSHGPLRAHSHHRPHIQPSFDRNWFPRPGGTL